MPHSSLTLQGTPITVTIGGGGFTNLTSPDGTRWADFTDVEYTRMQYEMSVDTGQARIIVNAYYDLPSGGTIAYNLTGGFGPFVGTTLTLVKSDWALVNPFVNAWGDFELRTQVDGTAGSIATINYVGLQFR